MELTTWDVVSLMIVPIMVYPALRFVQRPSRRWAWISLGVGACAFIMIARTFFLDASTLAFQRPLAAKDCGIFNNGGECGGKLGMPSGHVMTTAFVLFAVLWTSTHAKSVVWNLTFSGLVVVMAWSRVARQCHTPLQTLVGFVLGVGIAAVIATRLSE